MQVTINHVIVSPVLAIALSHTFLSKKKIILFNTAPNP